MPDVSIYISVGQFDSIQILVEEIQGIQIMADDVSVFKRWSMNAESIQIVADIILKRYGTEADLYSSEFAAN